MDVVATLLFCDRIQTSIVDGKAIQNIVRPIKSISPIAIPGNFSFSLYCSIERLSATESHTIRICIEASDGKVMYDTGSVPVNPNAGLTIDEGYFSTIEICIDARNAVIPSEETIKAVLYIDGDTVASTQLVVCKK